MTQELSTADLEPLNERQKVFARELGIARASGGRDEDLTRAYESAGYKPDRGNARRLAADPRVKAIADEACAQALELAGLHIQYLQAKALELLHASPTKIFRTIKQHQDAVRSDELTPEQRAEIDSVLDSVTWPLTEFKIDKDGIIAIKLPDKKGILEMLSKQLGYGKDSGNNLAVALSLGDLVNASLKKPQTSEAA